MIIDRIVCACVVRTPEGAIKLYCKGADAVILERLQKANLHEDSTKQALEVSADGSFIYKLYTMPRTFQNFSSWLSVYSMLVYHNIFGHQKKKRLRFKPSFVCLWWQVFAQSCLRTFCVAVRPVGEAQWGKWSHALQEVAMATTCQEAMLEELHDQMERDLMV